MIPVESRGYELIQGRVLQQIAGQLFNCKLIEGKIPIVCFDHPVPPTPHVTRTVILVTIGICVSSGIKPGQGHGLPIPRRGEQTIHQALVSVRRAIINKRLHLGASRGQTRQIQAQTANQGTSISLRRRVQAFFLKPLQDEVVDSIARPIGLLHFWQLGPIHRLE